MSQTPPTKPDAELITLCWMVMAGLSRPLQNVVRYRSIHSGKGLIAYMYGVLVDEIDDTAAFKELSEADQADVATHVIVTECMTFRSLLN